MRKTQAFTLIELQLQLNVSMMNSVDLYWMMEKSTRKIGSR